MNKQLKITYFRQNILNEFVYFDSNAFQTHFSPIFTKRRKSGFATSTFQRRYIGYSKTLAKTSFVKVNPQNQTCQGAFCSGFLKYLPTLRFGSHIFVPRL